MSVSDPVSGFNTMAEITNVRKDRLFLVVFIAVCLLMGVKILFTAESVVDGAPKPAPAR